MLAPHLKQKVDKLWNKFWTAGITNPLVAIEQITYLLFLKRLEGLDEERIIKNKNSIYDPQYYEKGDECRWSYIKQQSNDIQHLIDVVFPWLRQLESIMEKADTNGSDLSTIGGRMSDAYFQLDPGKGAILADAVKLIDELFGHVEASSVSDDIMGDTFEYLLSEISSAGKNGQFRTPRHIIRTLVEILDPQPGMRIIDPAAGTGGFLFSAMNHILKNNTAEESLKIEWDGTPHRADGAGLVEDFDEVFNGLNYVGIDNDRTMVRIGWMNMILHGVTNPQIHQRDSLGKRKEDDKTKHLIASETYDCVLANPPFTGSVDKEDLERTLFPAAGASGKKASLAITNKSELLFVWLMLDLLKVGGRCTVIVPEGVLFGNTDAHASLRRELLTEHLVEVVISLPAGAFQPYTGVKTSILVFQKETAKAHAREWNTNNPPRTQNVWFYEVEEEAYTLDAKRNERKGQNNDLWDVIKKFKNRYENNFDELVYFQPQYFTERWRFVDKQAMSVFADVKELQHWKDRVAGIHELFGLPVDPVQARELIEATQAKLIKKLVGNILKSATPDISEKMSSKNVADKKKEAKKALNMGAKKVRSLCFAKGIKNLFDQEEVLGWQLYQNMFKETLETETELNLQEIIKGKKSSPSKSSEDEFKKQIKTIAKEFAKLDGYDVMLRTIDVQKNEDGIKETKCWSAPVRVYAQNDEWESEDGQLKGSHDENNKIRPEYVESLELYDKKGKLKEALLDPDCIEAHNWKLSAGQYKPFSFETIKSDKSVAEMISELKKREQQIIEGLDTLLDIVEAR
ncbi:type I restriction-modification system subunit M [Desulfobacula phenolica]|uniref:site-specific DNA-methyltransferase (adenine-specific) n=1 Tax=Desulfobacula phenolica TaxID=90732 RepID=A0A1H2IA42_9BACT|nr:class I SAM-dependent DNA methyltransferase [Desulfobacula phenolica]SDU40911.1 type I restriction enzyme M protein [Desulfobacula phenolica]